MVVEVVKLPFMRPTRTEPPCSVAGGTVDKELAAHRPAQGNGPRLPGRNLVMLGRSGDVPSARHQNAFQKGPKYYSHTLVLGLD